MRAPVRHVPLACYLTCRPWCVYIQAIGRQANVIRDPLRSGEGAQSRAKRCVERDFADMARACRSAIPLPAQCSRTEACSTGLTPGTLWLSAIPALRLCQSQDNVASNLMKFRFAR